MRLWSDWREGRMLFPGGVAAQPAALVEAFRYMDGFIGQFQTDEHNRQRAEAQVSTATRAPGKK